MKYIITNNNNVDNFVKEETTSIWDAFEIANSFESATVFERRITYRDEFVETGVTADLTGVTGTMQTVEHTDEVEIVEVETFRGEAITRKSLKTNSGSMSIETLRSIAGLSRKELAKAANVSKRTIDSIERGEHVSLKSIDAVRGKLFKTIQQRAYIMDTVASSFKF